MSENITNGPSPIDIELGTIGEQLSRLDKMLSVLEDRLAPVANRSKLPQALAKPDELDKAESPIKNRLHDYSRQLTRIIERIDDTIAALDI